MPWVVRDAVDDLNRAVGRRWQGLDRLLPGRADLPEGCAAPLVANGANGRPAGLGVCRHQDVPADTLNQTWGAAVRGAGHDNGWLHRNAEGQLMVGSKGTAG